MTKLLSLICALALTGCALGKSGEIDATGLSGPPQTQEAGVVAPETAPSPTLSGAPLQAPLQSPNPSPSPSPPPLPSFAIIVSGAPGLEFDVVIILDKGLSTERDFDDAGGVNGPGSAMPIPSTGSYTLSVQAEASTAELQYTRIDPSNALMTVDFYHNGVLTHTQHPGISTPNVVVNY